MGRPRKNKEEEKPPTIKMGTGWLYHKTEEPRIFKDGEVRPDGWNVENRSLWKLSDLGVWSRVNR